MNSPSPSAEHNKTASRLLDQINAAISGPSSTRPLGKVVQLLRADSDHYDWVGIYLVKGDSLILAAYAGDAETEHIKIPIGQGICGLAAKQGATVVVPDVSEDPRYLMCFPSTRSEIVVPIKAGNKVLGEIDIDSDRLSAFTGQDRHVLESAATTLASYLEKQDSVSQSHGDL